jgi:hypothetical protein
VCVSNGSTRGHGKCGGQTHLHLHGLCVQPCKTIQWQSRHNKVQIPVLPSHNPTPASISVPANRAGQQSNPSHHPPSFSGKSSKLCAFRSQCKLVFRSSPDVFAGHQLKIMFAVSYLKGIAQRWFVNPWNFCDDWCFLIHALFCKIT